MDKYYSKTHEWVKADADDAIVGISEFAAKELGDVTYVEMIESGSDVIVGDTIGAVESVKASSDVYSPISGTISGINRALDDDPEIVSRSAEERGWLVKLENIDLTELDDLMTEEEYLAYLETL